MLHAAIINPALGRSTQFRISTRTPRPPAASPGYDGTFANPPLSKHNRKISPASWPSFIRPKDKGCGEIICSAPLTKSAIDSRCGCVYPIKVVIDVGVDSFIVLHLVQELESEVAAGIFLKKCQVKIVGALTSPRDQGLTEVTFYFVPLGNKFDKTTALFIYHRFWQKKVSISKSLFCDYEVINVHYPGLPSPPPPFNGSSEFGHMDAGSHEYPFTATLPTGMTEKMKVRIISVIVLSSSLLIFLCLGILIFVIKSMKNHGKNVLAPVPTASSIAKRPGIRPGIPSNIASSSSTSFCSTMATCPLTVTTFSLSELERATNDFSSTRKLGEGGSGCVYHGTMEDGSDVAIKLLKRVDQNKDREHEFISEIEMLSRLHHRNLVRLIGICFEGRRRCLVYELVHNGSVESHLHGADKAEGPLEWDARMKIALGSAKALAYLHEDSNPCVLHRDFKASNVLLEDDFTPKVSDFGLAREATKGNLHVSTRVMGTFGYVAPEYAMTGRLLIKSDVYSYGVVLLELLSGHKPVQIFNDQDDPESLVVLARPLLRTKEGLEQLIDPYLQENYDFDTIAKVASVASLCVHGEPSQRPFMGEVVQALKLITSNKEDSNYSRTHKVSSSFGRERHFGQESSNGWSPLFLDMVHSWDSDEDMQRPHSLPGSFRVQRRRKKKTCRAIKSGHYSV